jgi:hypothetical protein
MILSQMLSEPGQWLFDGIWMRINLGGSWTVMENHRKKIEKVLGYVLGLTN